MKRAAIEACCGAADLAQALIDEAGWSVSLAHPGFVSRMKQNPDKTDYCDARMLAELVRVGTLPEVWLAPARINELRLLVRLRDDLTHEVAPRLQDADPRGAAAAADRRARIGESVDQEVDAVA